MKTLIIVQARTGSTRLPNKVLKSILGVPVLIRQLDRISQAKLFDEIVVATTRKKEDDIIINLCNDFGYNTFRGSTDNLLDRHYKAAKDYEADVVVKIPSDCPLIDPAIIDKTLYYYFENYEKYDYVSNLHPQSYPDGNDVEVIPFDVLHYAWRFAEKNYELEHTTPFIWDKPDKFKIGNVEWKDGLNYSMTHRFTLDYEKDLIFIREIYNYLYPGKNNFDLSDILMLLEKKPELLKINEEYNGINWYRNHMKELCTINKYETRQI